MILRFGDCAIDPKRHHLLVSDQTVEVEPQVFDLIAMLAEADGDLVSKDDLVARVWRGLAVSDATINARISAARKALGDDGARQAVIRTVHRRGFCLAVPVRRVDEVPPSAALPPGYVQYARSADGAGIAWAAEGSGPTVIRIGHWLSHLDLDRQSTIWQPLIARLGQGRRLIRYDLRGTGLSQRGVPLDGIDRFVADLAAVADAAGADRFAVFAPSQAVPVAVAFAARHPGRITRLVLYGGYAQGRRIRNPADGELESDTATALIRAGWGQRGSVFLESFIRLFAPDATRDQVAEVARMQAATADAETAIRLRREIDLFDVSDRLRDVPAPALVMHAADDVIHPVSQGQMLAAGLRDARFVLLPGRNHVPLPQTPEWSAMMAAAEAFLDAG